MPATHEKFDRTFQRSHASTPPTDHFDTGAAALSSTATTTTIPTSVSAAFEAYNAGDPEPLIALYAEDDVLVIGTDASYLDQPAAIAHAFRAEAGQLRADWSLRAQPLGADGLLLIGRISFVLADGNVIGTRATYVLRRDGDDWRIVHSHLSVPQG
jgi:ketosteroid isomerase-like protein